MSDHHSLESLLYILRYYLAFYVFFAAICFVEYFAALKIWNKKTASLMTLVHFGVPFFIFTIFQLTRIISPLVYFVVNACSLAAIHLYYFLGDKYFLD